MKILLGEEHGDGYGAGGGSYTGCASEETLTGHDGVVILDLI